MDTREKLEKLAEGYASKDINELFAELEEIKKDLNIPSSYQGNQN